jgi:hypothetical protein
MIKANIFQNQIIYNSLGGAGKPKQDNQNRKYFHKKREDKLFSGGQDRKQNTIRSQ